MMSDNLPPFIELPADEEHLGDSLSEIRRYATEMSTAAHLEKEAMHRLRLALDEIATNIILYAYADIKDGVLTVSGEIDANCLSITIEDSGIPYDPLQYEMPDDLGIPLEDRNVGGMGIYLAIINVDEFSYRRIEGKNVNILKMYRPGSEADLIAKSKEASSQSAHILIVDNRDTNRMQLVQHLTNRGYVVDTAVSGTDILERLNHTAFDLLLLTCELPGLSGIEVIQKIEAEVDDAPAIAVISHKTDIDYAVRAIQAGADDYIQEPYNPILLNFRIEALLEKKNLREQHEAELQRTQELLNQLELQILPFSISLLEELHYDRLFERILIEAQNICNADGAILGVCDGDMLDFRKVNIKSLNWDMGGEGNAPVFFEPVALHKEDGSPNFDGVMTYVANTKNTINVPDIYQSDLCDFSRIYRIDKEHNYRSKAILTIPLKDHEDQVVAVIHLINPLNDAGEITPFDNYHRLVVEVLASQAAVVMNNHRLLQRQKQLNKIENDIQVASQIQSNFLPTTLPEEDGFDLAMYFRPARDVAGDFYDAFMMLQNRRIGLVIADVCDKGVGAALFMSLTRSLLRSFATTATSRSMDWISASLSDGEDAASKSQRRLNIQAGALLSAMANTNQYITTHHQDLLMFATTFFGMFNPDTGQLYYINGGHCPPWIISPAGEIKEQLQPTGPAVGMFNNAVFNIKVTDLEPGDILLGYTDGITDARNADREMFGEDRLQALLTPPASSADELVDRIVTALLEHIGEAVQYDDITLFALQREGLERE